MYVVVYRILSQSSDRRRFKSSWLLKWIDLIDFL